MIRFSLVFFYFVAYCELVVIWLLFLCGLVFTGVFYFVAYCIFF